ncbi:uncharacterized protein LOC116848336 [Odontomachus brunneus]|uniref:uncharacterized protein LOC116848336 n=1 Tax=Odontomachus brunneus TaxID=486640 RepID=UPI0013F295D4|nr:uncharacterized protein LOC116848336 [Odontomachus brunneus]XP_032680183.1 uncharacterized protein LOC116848336 [Odontomachus brunneus]
MPTNSMNVIILFTLMATCVATPIFVAHPTTVLAHPAVLINSAMEDNLPNELRNDFYKNSNIAAGLAKESWFIDKESQVLDRETDKIPREKIYSVLHNAGLVRR